MRKKRKKKTIHKWELKKNSTLRAERSGKRFNTLVPFENVHIKCRK